MLSQEDIKQVNEINDKLERIVDDVDILIDRMRKDNDAPRVRSLRTVRGILTNTSMRIEGLFQ